MAKILIIDDDIDIIDSIKIVLESRDHLVVYQTDSEEAESSVLAEKPEIIILDVSFPGRPTAGFDVCRDLKDHPEIKEIPIIMLSAINTEYKMAFPKITPGSKKNWLPAEYFMEKPIDPEKLLSTVADILSGN